MTTPADRALVERLIAGPVSGDALAREAGLTRAAVWKRVEALREAGVPITARAGRGYALAAPLDLLDAASILAALPDAVRARIGTLEVAWSVDSTSSELLRRPGGEGAQVLLAERQTAGRGRRGRAWASPLAANLYLSVARRFDAGLARLGGLSLVAGIAVSQALHALGATQARLKWPNDVVVPHADGLRKLGGVLVEGGGEHGGPARAVVGIGLNVRMPARAGDGIDQPWIDLAAVQHAPPPRDRLAAALLAHLLPALAAFDRDGLAPFLPQYAALDALAGQPVRVLAGDGEACGVALGLAADGALRVRLAQGERAFHAGEVSLRRAEAAA